MADSLAGLRKRPVLLEEFGVYVKPLSVGQIRAFGEWRKDNRSGAEAVQMLVSMSVCDATGTLLLASPADAADLDFRLCEALCEKISELNGFAEKPADPKAESSATEPPSSVG